MNRLRTSFAPYWQSIQRALFPQLESVLGPLTAKQQQLVQTLEVIRIEQMIPRRFRVPGRPPKDRAAMARAFVAKAVYDMPTTRVLLDRLDTDVALRRLCGWERRSEVPSESVVSRNWNRRSPACGKTATVGSSRARGSRSNSTRPGAPASGRRPPSPRTGRKDAAGVPDDGPARITGGMDAAAGRPGLTRRMRRRFRRRVRTAAARSR